MFFSYRKSRRGLTFIGAVVIAVAFLIAIMLAISWIISSQKAYFTKPNMVAEKAEAFSGGNVIWLEIKNYGMSIATLREIYVYDTEAGKYYIAYPNGTIRDPETNRTVGTAEIKPLSASEGEYLYAKLTFNAGVLKGNLITGIAVFDKTLAPWKLYRVSPPISKPGYAVNAWRIKLFIYNPSDLTVFSDQNARFLPGTPVKKPIAVILINKYAGFAGHFFNWTCGEALTYGWTPGSDIIFTDAYRKTLLPFYRYYFNCTTNAAIFIVYLKNVTIFPHQTYPIYLWYAPWGGVNITITDHSNETIYYMAVNNSFQDLFSTEPAWYYNNGLYSRMAWIRDNTANQMDIEDQNGNTYYLNLSDTSDWEWDSGDQDHIYCDVSSGDPRCTLVYLNMTDGFFERFEVGGWYYYQYPEGYTWLMETAFNLTETPPQRPYNQVYVIAMTPYIFYRYGWWFGRWYTGAWYGWIMKTFGATAANWGIISSGRYLKNTVPPRNYTYIEDHVVKVVFQNNTIRASWFRYYAYPSTRISLIAGINLTNNAVVKINIYNDTSANRVRVTIVDLNNTNNKLTFSIVPGGSDSAVSIYVNSTGGYIKTFLNGFDSSVYFYDPYYPSLGYVGVPAYAVITRFIRPRYFGVWWIASWWADDNTRGIIWTGNEIEASLKTIDLSKLDFSKLRRLIYSYTSGADLVGSQFAWMGISSEGRVIDDDYGNPQPLIYNSTRRSYEVEAEVAGAYGDELIEGNTVGFSTVVVTSYGTIQSDWIRVIIGLGYIWWEGPVLDQWPLA